jgi:hypothetical protein
MTIAAARAVAVVLVSALIACRTRAVMDAGADGACHRAVAKARDCDGGASPVCGCDGVVYPSECAAYAAGVDLDVTGACRDRVPDWAPCGAHYCNADTSYCEIYLSDVPEIPTDHFCRPLPESCLRLEASARTCECFASSTPCRSFCGPLPTGGRPAFHLTCQGRSPPPAP